MKTLTKIILPLLIVTSMIAGSALTGEARGRTYRRIYIRHPRPAVHVLHSSPAVAGRSSAARQAFLRRLGLKQEPKGYVIDHIIPLCAGGADDPRNMQLQTVEAAKIKDRWEKAYCRSRYWGAHH